MDSPELRDRPKLKGNDRNGQAHNVACICGVPSHSHALTSNKNWIGAPLRDLQHQPASKQPSSPLLARDSLSCH